MTPILGETQEGIKTTRKSLSVLPEVVIYDVELTLSLPPAVSAASGLNAIAHAIEALYARDTNPIVGLMAVEGISALSLIIEEPSGIPPHDQTPSRALGCAACAWAPSAWRCTTSSATRWEARSRCRMPRRTRYCCHIRRPTTHRRLPPPWAALRGRSETTTPHGRKQMSAIKLHILKPSVNNMAARVFVRAAKLDFTEDDVWGKTRSSEFLSKEPGPSDADDRNR